MGIAGKLALVDVPDLDTRLPEPEHPHEAFGIGAELGLQGLGRITAEQQADVGAVVLLR